MSLYVFAPRSGSRVPIVVPTGAPPATHLSLTTQPSSTATSGVAFAQQPVIQLRDASNAAVHQSGVSVVASVASGADTLSGTTTAVTSSLGVATFTDLALTGADTDQLAFAASGLTGVTSSNIVVTASGAFFPNLPAGFTQYGTKDCSVLPATRNVPDADGWAFDDDGDVDNLSVILDSSIGTTSPAFAAGLKTNHDLIDGLLPGGSPGGSATYQMECTVAAQNWTEMFLGVSVMWSSNFNNTNGNSGCKWIWPVVGEVGDNSNYTSLSTATMNMEMIQQNTIDNERGANVNAGVAVMNQYLGQWVKVEFYWKWNSANGVADGLCKIWVNGTLVLNYSNMDYRAKNISNPSPRVWEDVNLENTYGGGLNPVPHDQHQYYDYFLIAGKA